MVGEGLKIVGLVNKPEWIKFLAGVTPNRAADVSPAAAQHAQHIVANLVAFDEAIGAALNTQHVEDSIKRKEVCIERTVPWREWLSVYAEPKSELAADKASAVAVLQTLQRTCPMASMPIEMCERAGKTLVRATSNIEVGQLMLPP